MLLGRLGQSNKFWKKSWKNFGTSKFEYSEGPLGDVLRTSWERPESIPQLRCLNVRLVRPLAVISGRPQDVRLGCTRDVRSGRSRAGQIGSLGDFLAMLELDVLGTSQGPIFAGWVGNNFFNFFYVFFLIKVLNHLEHYVHFLDIEYQLFHQNFLQSLHKIQKDLLPT